MKSKKRFLWLTLIVFMTLAVFPVIAMAFEPTPKGLSQKERFKWIVTKRLTVINAVIFGGSLSVAGDVAITGALDVDGATTLNSTLDVDGAVTSGSGAFTVTDNVVISGTANEIQLEVIASVTQITDIVNIKDVSGTTLYTMDPSGNLYIAGTSDMQGALYDSGGDLTLGDTVLATSTLDVTGAAMFDSTIAVTGTSDLRGNVSDSAGSFTIADNVVVSGTADLTQLQVVGSVGQSSHLLDVQQSDGTDALTVGGDLILTVSGVSMFEDNVTISGTRDIRQFSITGTIGQSTYDIMLIESYTGTDYLTVGPTGHLYVASTSDLVGNIYDSGGTLTIDDNALVTGTLDVAGAAMFDSTLAVTSTSDLRGNVSDSAGDFTIADNVVVSGTQDVVQLQVSGSSANLASDLFYVTNLTATELFSVDYEGNLYAAGTFDLAEGIYSTAGDVTVADAFVVTGTTDLQGNVSDSTGSFTISDNTVVIGSQDAIQFTVDGSVAQSTANIVVIESFTGTDYITVGPTGHLYIASTTDMVGNVYDSGGTFTVDDDAYITGTLDVSGAAMLDSTLAVTSTSDLRGNVSDSAGTFTIADDVLVDGQADAVQLTVQGNGTQTSNLLTGEDSGGSDVFGVDVSGNITYTGVIQSSDGAVDLGGTLVHSSVWITPTFGETVTPPDDAVSLYLVQTTGNTSMTLAACTDGSVLYLYGADANNVTVNDTNIRTTDGNAVVFDQYDMVHWVCAMSEWNLCIESNNQ